MCTSRSRRQKQLVEVPTIISYSSLLQRTMEQNVNIPVLGRGGRNAGLQGFLPRQSSTAQLASQERISERIVEQIVDSRMFWWRSSKFSPRTEFICIFFISSWCPWFCRCFSHSSPKEKSAKIGPHSGSELSADESSSTLSAHQMAPGSSTVLAWEP